MSRARVHEVSSPISLFPFIGILLCTMGALLVVLVAVSRSARDSAEQQVQSKRRAAPAVDEAHKKRMDYVKQYVTKLNSVRSEAEKRLRDEHSHLSNVEDHIRRLQDRMRELQVAADEMAALEKEHYDDREQAGRETARLNELIDDARKSIADLQQANANEKASYAVVPYEGPNGTFRRPIYIECLENEIVLQPEGVKISSADLHPPYGPGNPLASALRTSRDHLVRLHPGEGKSRDTEPYPLLLVRSQGLIMFDRARQAIDAGDFDLGFELVEDDWKLKFPLPNPQLAGLQQDAIEQARARQEVLAAAAPRAYRGGGGSFDADDFGADDDGDFGGDRYGSNGGEGFGSGSGGGGSGSNTPSRPASAAGGGGSGGSGAPGSGGRSAGGGGGQAGADAGDSDGGAPSGGNPASPPASMAGVSGGSAGAGYVGGGSGSGMSVAASDPNAPPELGGQQQNVSMMMGSPPPDGGASSSAPRGSAGPQRFGEVPADTRGKDWALKQKPQKSSPIRRTIRVEVHENQLAILPDGAPNSAQPVAGKVVPLQGDTVQSLDEFVKQVREQIEGWGIAGNGLYWRPVVILKVAPDGNRRAGDLARLLKNSGLELRNEETAANVPAGKIQ